VIAEAPVRTLVAGMGDALATRFEAESCRLASVPNATGHRGAFVALALARLCYDTLIAEGPLARRACEDDAVTEGLERIVEANTLLSGIGFESGGLATAHALDKAFLAVAGPREVMHGERVAFGTLASLFLTAKPSDLVDEVYRFARAVGLPTTLAGISLGEASDGDLRRIADAASAEGSKIHNEPRPVSPEEVVFALRCADKEGRRRDAEPVACPLHAGSPTA
jgi:glycerol dehydrogenase